MDGAAAVAHGGAVCAVTLDNAGVALTFADAGDVDAVADGEGVRLQLIAHVQGFVVVQLEFLQDFQVADACLCQVALLATGQVLVGGGHEAQLYGLVAVFFGGLLLHDTAGARLDDGNGHDLAVGVKDLGHADLFADDCLFHTVVSSLV